MTEFISYDCTEGIGVITIDRPAKKNAMTFAMLGDFIEAVGVAGGDDACRVLVVTGVAGSFCAGTDLADLATIPGKTRGVRGEAHEDDKWWPLVACPKPVIGAIDGPAVGMGAEFASQCDVRIASPRARFAWNFAHRGLVPDTGAGTWLLPRLIGPGPAMRLLYSGAFIDATEAHRLGFVHEIVEPESVLDAARAEATRFLGSSPMSLRKMKALVYEGLGADVGAHMERHVATLKECFGSDDHHEGVTSFLEKRSPVFTGR